ncbi:MAG: hypothetical protein DMG63_18875 [Acidobacteria bacterium]|nr:MAG: hypothetical protein DMG63_18875 [Acidobacteriota bacterium]
METTELIRQTKINRVKSEQAIRRSKTLVKLRTTRIGNAKNDFNQPQGVLRMISVEPEALRRRSREVRERSRQAIAQSLVTREATRQRKSV